jgi:putative transposase
MENKRKGSHSVDQLHVHLVWSTKYRYSVLKGEVQIRRRDLIRQVCDSMDVRILKGVVSKDSCSSSCKVSSEDIYK